MLKKTHPIPYNTLTACKQLNGAIWRGNLKMDNIGLKQFNYSPHLMSEMKHGCHKQRHIPLLCVQTDSEHHLRRCPLLQKVKK